MKHTVLFLTRDTIKFSEEMEYNYEDSILTEFWTGETFVNWSGQKRNSITDNLVLNDQTCNKKTMQDPKRDIHIWYRKKRNDKYKYLGKVKEKKIIQSRTNRDILVVRLFMEQNNLPIKFNTEAETFDYEYEGGHKFQKYKQECFNLLKLEPMGNWCSGIMEGISKKKSKMLTIDNFSNYINMCEN